MFPGSLRVTAALLTGALLVVACGVAQGASAAADSAGKAAEIDTTHHLSPGPTSSDTTRTAGPRLTPVDSLRAAKFKRTAADTARAATPAIAVADTARRQPPTEPTGFERPRWVMLRSLVIPGWGQAHNGRWIKAGVIAGIEGLFIARVVDDKRELDRLNGEIERAQPGSSTEAALIDQYNARSERFVGNQWWLGGLLAYSLLDAYIDAHFRNFDIDLENDPALPPEERRSTGLKLSWQRHF